MNRIAINLGWEVLAHHRWTFAGLGAVLACATVFATWRGSAARTTADPYADLFVLAMVLSMLFVFGVFNHTHLDRRSGQTGFPTRLFTYPIATRWLVGVPMMCAVATVVVIYLAWVELVLEPLGRTLPEGWPALVLAAAMACYQAALWTLAAFSVARIITLCLLGTTFVTIALLPAFDPSGEWFTAPARTASMALLILTSYVVALVSVERQRHAGGHGAGLRVVFERIADAIPTRTRPFRSPLHAQLWIELRRTGVLLPAGTLLVMLFICVVAAIVGRVNADSTIFTLITIGLTPIVLGGLAGGAGSLPVVTTADSSLSPFLSTRPMSCAVMIVAKLLAAGVGAALAWLIVIVLTPVWLLACCDTTPVASAWQHFSVAFPGRQGWMMLVMMAVSVWLITWRASVTNLHVGVAGRHIILVGCVLGGIALQTAAIILLVNGLSAAHAVVRHASLLALLLDLTLLTKLIVAAISGAAAVRQDLVSERAAEIGAALWLAMSALVATTLYLAVARLAPPALAEMPWLKLHALLVALLLMPLARLAIAPATLAANRHR